MIVAIVNANLLDTERMEIVGERSIVMEDDRIVDVSTGPPTTDADLTIDARGEFALPGFVDGHVHLQITSMNFSRMVRQSATEHALGMARLAEATVRRGFTTVRDTGGDIHGLIRSIDLGLCIGPRVATAGRVISQTGGHGDVRFSDIPTPGCACELYHDRFGVIADGADAVRKAARHELRQGANFLKIMTSGGVASPTDPFDCIQYTPAEVEAATTEADNRHTYVTAHAYMPDAIRLAVDNGARCIEHGNLIDTATAEHLAALGVILVPTLVTYQAMDELGAKLGLPEVSQDKNMGVLDQGLASIEIAKAAGVELGLGTDLLGETQSWQNRELAIRSQLEPAIDVLTSMYRVNPRLCRMEGQVGVITPGAYADVLVTDVNPFERLADLAEPSAHLSAVIKGGQQIV